MPPETLLHGGNSIAYSRPIDHGRLQAYDSIALFKLSTQRIHFAGLLRDFAHGRIRQAQGGGGGSFLAVNSFIESVASIAFGHVVTLSQRAALLWSRGKLSCDNSRRVVM